jgi:hypothetical protein
MLGKAGKSHSPAKCTSVDIGQQKCDSIVLRICRHGKLIPGPKSFTRQAQSMSAKARTLPVQRLDFTI